VLCKNVLNRCRNCDWVVCRFELQRHIKRTWWRWCIISSAGDELINVSDQKLHIWVSVCMCVNQVQTMLRKQVSRTLHSPDKPQTLPGQSKAFPRKIPEKFSQSTRYSGTPTPENSLDKPTGHSFRPFPSRCQLRVRAWAPLLTRITDRRNAHSRKHKISK